MTYDAKTETGILIGLIVLFSLLGGVSLWRDQPPFITAFCLALVATACLYRFLGGVEGSRLTVASFKAGGSVAVFGAALWFANEQLAAGNPLINPAPSEWIAVDRIGTPIEVTIGQTTVSADTDLLTDAVWTIERHDDGLRVLANDVPLALVDQASLSAAGLFNYAGMAGNRRITFTGPLEQEKAADLYPPYPFWIEASNYHDNYNGYAIMDMTTDTAVATGLLVTKTFDVFSYEGRSYVVFVSRAVHNDPERAPWADFGFAELDLDVR